MANVKNLSTKMVLEYEDALSGKKTRYTFPYVLENVTDGKLEDIANALNALQETAYSQVFKTVETEIY